MFFRCMTEQDLEIVVGNERQSYSHPWTEGAFKDCLEGLAECWVVLNYMDTIGHLVISNVLDEGHILNLCIGRSWQGKGWSHEVLTFALNRLWQLRVSTVFLEVRESNHRARALYTRHGFIEAGLRKNYYPAGTLREHAIVMSKELKGNHLAELPDWHTKTRFSSK